MTTYFDFDSIERKARADFIRKLRFLRYWKKIEHLFAKKSKRKVTTFTYSFKHDFRSSIHYDNEFTIEGIADHYGYKIVGEQLGGKFSTYTFERK